jgi:hypothetical protein
MVYATKAPSPEREKALRSFGDLEVRNDRYVFVARM